MLALAGLRSQIGSDPQLTLADAGGYSHMAPSEP
jgi:hypothetical protein